MQRTKEDDFLDDMVREGVHGILSTSKYLDKFSSWLMVGVGAVITMLITHADGIIKSFTHGAFLSSVILLAISIVFGVVGKACFMQSIGILSSYNNTIELLEKYFQKRGEEFPADFDFIKVINERYSERLSSCFPKFLRNKVFKKSNEGVKDTLSAHRIAMKFYCLQWLMLIIQLFILIAFIVVVLCYIR